jgi:hypothetical protein
MAYCCPQEVEGGYVQEEIQATCVVAFAKHPCNLKHCDERMHCIDEEIQNIEKILAGFESIKGEKRKDTPLIT